MVDQLDSVRRLEDAGAAAVVMRSLFEEQITNDQIAEFAHTENPAESFSEATSYFPSREDYAFGPDRYLEQISRIKESVSIPVIASLNGVSQGGWTDYARLIEQAGADALELNVYYIATNPDEPGLAVAQRTLDILKAVKGSVTIPIAVKLSPFFSSPGHFAKQLVSLGAAGVILFNRFYQPDIDLANLVVEPDLVLSSSIDLRLPLRWIAILYGRVSTDFALTSGVHTHEDALKAMMAGANVVQLASELLHSGPGQIGKILSGMSHWMEEFEYSSITQMRGSMSQRNVVEPAAFERANYMKVLHSFRPDPTGRI